jgi:tetratricopeptide (TPR) repeat protein
MRQKINEVDLLDTILLYKERFPALLNNQNFKSLNANAYLVAVIKHMEINNVKVAEEYLSSFEKLYGESSDLVVDPSVTGNAYSALCTYYFKKGQKEKARNLLKKGLEIAPNNYELRVRQQMIN